MNKYFVLFSTPAATMQDWMTNVDEATRKQQMDQMMTDWKAWMEKNKDAIVEEGMPLGKTKRVTKEGVTDTRNDLNYTMMIQAESHEAAADMLKDNPHFMIPNSYVEVMDVSGPSM
jgi:hypothetical protein